MKLSLKKISEFEDIAEFFEFFQTEQDCVDYLEKIIWKGKMPTSPFDITSQVYECDDQETKGKNSVKYKRYRCRNTGKYFNVKNVTIFKNSKLPLLKWFLALFYLSIGRISSYQLIEHIKMTQKTSWFVIQRLRIAFEIPDFETMLKNVVEIDEAFFGGKNKNRHKDKKAPKCQGRNWKDKIPMFGMLERGGNLIIWVVPNTRWKTLEPIIRANIKESSTVNTDEWYRKSNLSRWYNHQMVNHRIKQYANGKVSVNGVENVWSNFKRDVYGTYRYISRKHAQKYANEFAFRFNTRKYSTKDRFDLVLSSSVGKNITYRELIA